MKSETVYLRTTNMGGKVSYTEHEVWDKEKFLFERQMEQVSLHAKEEKNTGKRLICGRCDYVTRDDYRKESGRYGWGKKAA